MRYQYQKTVFIATLLFCFTLPVPTWSADNSGNESISSHKSAPILETITVTGTQPSPLTGLSTLDSNTIENLPSRNGNMNDLLSTSPGVQLSEEAHDSFSAGEIKPSEISISGGKTYENNFLIDGIGNNNLIDPVADNESLSDSIPRHSQSIFLSTKLIDNINVYTHNIPARYGSFTGGVVEAETKDPGPDFGGSISYRLTSDSWTQFHIDEEDKEDFYHSNSSYHQPEFTKQQTGFDLNIPLTTDSGVLAAYTINHSIIPLEHLTETKDQERKSENFFLKYLIEPTAHQKLSMTALYAPYSEHYFLKTTKDSQFSIDGDSFSISANYITEAAKGTLNFDVGHSKSSFTRHAPDQYFFWRSNFNDIPTSKDWGLLVDSNFSKEGGFGDLKSDQQVSTLLIDWVSIPINHGELSQTFNLGISIERMSAEFERPDTIFSYSIPKQITDATLCIDGDPACIDSEQYLSKRKTSPEGHSEALNHQYSAYIENLFTYKRLLLRPGLRFSHDTLMENNNTAPRFVGAYELSRSVGTTLIGGWNRYYSQNLMVYKLREGIVPYISDTRDSADSPFPQFPNEFELPTNRFTSLNTPYSDEVSFGISQTFLSSELKLNYIRRYNEDQIARERVFTDSGFYYILNNNGSGEYENYSASWEKQWRTHFLNINAAYSKILSSNMDYDDTLDADDLQEQIWYKGEKLYPDELPREDFNRPWSVNITYTKEFNNHLTFTNVTKYRSHYKAIENSREETEEGLDIYTDVSKPSAITFDWSITQGIPLANNHMLDLNIDIFNVFNKKNHVGTEDDRFSLGRQFWLGMELFF